jgi:hypothetical protein
MKTTHYYEITVRGRLGDTLVGAFDGMTTKSSPAKTVLCGEIVDQAALFAVFERIDSLGLELLDVRSNSAAW